MVRGGRADKKNVSISKDLDEKKKGTFSTYYGRKEGGGSRKAFLEGQRREVRDRIGA